MLDISQPHIGTIQDMWNILNSSLSVRTHIYIATIFWCTFLLPFSSFLVKSLQRIFTMISIM